MAYPQLEKNIEKLNEEITELQYGLSLTEKEEWDTYSIKEVQKMFGLEESEASLLVKSGIFKIHKVGNEYRATKKSVVDKKKVIKSVTTYRNKKSMKVSDMAKLLGLGKTASYRLISKEYFKTYLVMGVMRVDVKSFEEWYAGQFHYKKITGEQPGQKYGDTIAPIVMARVFDIHPTTAREFMDKGWVETVTVGGKRRVVRSSFEKWCETQSHYKMVRTIEEAEEICR